MQYHQRLPWERCFDWCSLAHASFTCMSFIDASATRLSNLTSLELCIRTSRCLCNIGEKVDRLRVFILSCRQLNALSLTNCTMAVDEQVLTHVGGGLH